jgi:hypothetical protein
MDNHHNVANKPVCVQKAVSVYLSPADLRVWLVTGNNL